MAAHVVEPHLPRQQMPGAHVIVHCSCRAVVGVGRDLWADGELLLPLRFACDGNVPCALQDLQEQVNALMGAPRPKAKAKAKATAAGLPWRYQPWAPPLPACISSTGSPAVV